jgi:uncharacterized protein
MARLTAPAAAARHRRVRTANRIARELTSVWTIATFASAGCAAARTTCPDGTTLAHHIYSGLGESEWCRTREGVREGPEAGYYENGEPFVTGSFADGAQSGIWRYHFADGRTWRADRWDDGALVQRTVDAAVARMSAADLQALGPTSSGIIKLASRDPTSGDGRDAEPTPFVSRFANGGPRVAGSYDADGLRVGMWRFWYADGRPARELEFVAGVRERGAREWHPTGAPAADGSYVAGERQGRWRFWDARGQLIADVTYEDGDAAPAVAARARPAGGMLPRAP